MTTTPPTGSEQADGLEAVLGKALHKATCGDPDACCWLRDEEGGPTCEDNTPTGLEAPLAAAVRAHLAVTLDAAREDVARAIYETFYGSSSLGWDAVDHEAWGTKADAALAVLAARLTPTDNPKETR